MVTRRCFVCNRDVDCDQLLTGQGLCDSTCLTGGEQP